MSKRRKKPWQYMTVSTGVSENGEVFPPTKARKQFKLPLSVTGKGLKNTTAICHASSVLKLSERGGNYGG